MTPITAAVAQVTSSLKPGTWLLHIDPPGRTARPYNGCAIVSVHTVDQEGAQIRTVEGPDGQPVEEQYFGLPPGHDGWDHTVISPEGATIGQFHNLGQAIACAQGHTGAAAKPAAPVATVSAPEAPATVKTTLLEETTDKTEPADGSAS